MENRVSSAVQSDFNEEIKHLPRRQRENLRQRREILDAALSLFSERGYHNVSIHEVAAKAEFGIGTIYKFFDNKECLYKALMMETAKNWDHVLNRALEKESNSLRAIERYIAARRKLFYENFPIMRLYFAETRGASFNIQAGLDQDLLKYYDEGIAKLASVFERGIKDGLFRDLDSQQMALALDGVINAALSRIVRDPSRLSEEDNVSTVTDIFFSGVLRK